MKIIRKGLVKSKKEDVFNKKLSLQGKEVIETSKGKVLHLNSVAYSSKGCCGGSGQI